MIVNQFQSMVLKPAHSKDVMVLFYDVKSRCVVSQVFRLSLLIWHLFVSSTFKNIIRGVEAKFPKSSVVFAEFDITGKPLNELPHPFKEIAPDIAKTPALYFYRQGQGGMSDLWPVNKHLSY